MDIGRGILLSGIHRHKGMIDYIATSANIQNLSKTLELGSEAR